MSAAGQGGIIDAIRAAVAQIKGRKRDMTLDWHDKPRSRNVIDRRDPRGPSLADAIHTVLARPPDSLTANNEPFPDMPGGELNPYRMFPVAVGARASTPSPRDATGLTFRRGPRDSFLRRLRAGQDR